ncbi:MAG TPA: ribosome biogenesis GTPase Der [Rubrobacteraceae bacterium]|nr:ribosome biogenesis GTPase Der [Rubrobacteraceae bacterium]
MSRLPVVAVVGAPNVGKSSLVNRIIGRRRAVVSDEPGTTRDRGYDRAEWAGREFLLVDTGGMEPAAKVGLQSLVTLQAGVAVEEADVIVHVVDARVGPSEADAAIARQLRRAPGRVVLAVNKLDNPADDTERYGFYSLGEGEPHPVSALHGLGVGDLLDEVVSLLPEVAADEEDGLPRLAIVGRPNVGKSTLLNRLLGSERAVVSEVAGTTTDAVAGEVKVGAKNGEERRYLLLDTAGVGRGARKASGVPYYSSLRTAEAIRRAEVSLLLVDAVDGLVAGDLRIARQIEEAGSSCGVLVNKRDLVSPERIREIEGQLHARMTDLKPPSLAVSALTGKGVDGVLLLAARLRAAYNLRVSTHEVAEFVNEVVGRNAPPRGVKIRYATQTGTAPPRFTLFANRPTDLPESYLRYVENSLRERYDLWGVSVRIRVKSSR